MFPTFISILDIQSWWEVPSIAHFCSLFRTAFNLLDFDIEDLEEALLTDGTEESSWLQELIVRLLTGCLPNNEISTFNYQMFLRRLFREKCKEHDRYNPFNTDIDFQLLPLRTKVDILHALCDFRLDGEDVLEQLKNLEADSLRVEPLGFDNNESAYWYFYGTRLYREDFKSKSNKKGKSVWQVVCFTEDDWFQLAKKFKKSQSKTERQLYHTLTENFLPELPRLFCEKERLARKRLLDNQPRRTSSRLDTKRKQEEAEKIKQIQPSNKEENVLDELQKKKALEKRRQEAYERRTRLREQGIGDKQKFTESRYEMDGENKHEKKFKVKQRRSSNSSSGSRDGATSITRSFNQSKINSQVVDRNKFASGSAKINSTETFSPTIGRQTNNSLASATGQIVIQSVPNSTRKKLKTSLVFRQTEEDLQTGMHKILDYVKNHDDAWPFIDPVEEEYAPNYYSVIRKPMDLQRMEERLDSGYYKTFTRFRSDFQLIVDNCRLYNGVDNEYTEMVGNLLIVFEKATERYLDQITSSDEEIGIEYTESDLEQKPVNRKKKNYLDVNSTRKPTLVAHTDRKRELSLSDDSVSKRSNSVDSTQKTIKQSKSKTINRGKMNRRVVNSKSSNKTQKSSKYARKVSKLVGNPVGYTNRSRSYSSGSQGNWSRSASPLFSSSPDSTRNSSIKKKDYLNFPVSKPETCNKLKGTEKQKERKEETSNESEHREKNVKLVKNKERSPSPPKQKDKHTKLRETIEKLKAKSELSNKVKNKNTDNERVKDFDQHKSKKFDLYKIKLNSTAKTRNDKRHAKIEDEVSSSEESEMSENKNQRKKEMKTVGNKNAAIEALTLATEQTLKDINKWLDDTPRLSEFSSASNSPSHYIGTEEFDGIVTKIENDYRKKIDKSISRKEVLGKEIRRRTFHNRDPIKFLKKREVQRTIDRLQPGKSKGNLLSNVQSNVNKVDDIYPLGSLSKIKDTKNSLIVKRDEATPKLSLGSVLDSFGKHKFVDDLKKDELDKCSFSKSTEINSTGKEKIVNSNSDKKCVKVEDDKLNIKTNDASPGKATPNLSAWFKAFGTPKVLPPQKKVEIKFDSKDNEKLDEVSNKESKTDESRKLIPPDISPNSDNPTASQGQSTSRQRKMSTGSTISERSSFSQDMDSPRIGIDERLGTYPAPYPSPLHRSPSDASPVMSSPRPDVSPKSTYPTVNGQIRVGFYQDTVSNKSSPDKSCSPQSPYPQYSEHIYSPSTTETSTYSYSNPYYTQLSNYSSPSAPSYNTEQVSSTFYDTNKSLTDQYQAKMAPNYSSNYQNINLNSPRFSSANSPSYQQLPSPNYDSYQQQQQPRVLEKSQQTTAFPVKKRVYNSNESSQILTQTQDQDNYDGNYELSRQLNIDSTRGSAINSQEQQVRPDSRNNSHQYIHQNIPNPRSSNIFNQEGAHSERDTVLSQPPVENMRNASNYGTPSNLYNYNNEVGYTTDRPLDLNSRPSGTDKKLEISKYSNVEYIGSGQYAYGRNTLTNLSAKASDPQDNVQDIPTNEMMVRYAEATDYRSTDMNISQPSKELLPQTSESSSYKSEMSMPRPSYSSSSGLNMGNITNLTHIVDRFSDNMYYDKNLSASHMYNKPIVSSTSSLTMFSQPYAHDMQSQATQSPMYNRQLTELQSPKSFPQQPAQPQQPEKKSKRRKGVKTHSSIATDSTAISTSSQGFQSYSGLKTATSIEPSAISLKTASVVPGSAFNFGPTPTGLGLSSGLYGEKDTYSNFLEDYRTAPNYYMAAAAVAAHHRSTETGEKQVRSTHQSTSSPASGYPFIAAPQSRPPSYPFMSPHQAPPLMDASSPLYQQYLQAGVLHQGLLAPPGAYPPGYHPALSIRQPFDSMTRPSWL